MLGQDGRLDKKILTLAAPILFAGSDPQDVVLAGALVSKIEDRDDCGTSVSGATDAARGAVAMILTAPGLSVINSAIDEADLRPDQQLGFEILSSVPEQSLFQLFTKDELESVMFLQIVLGGHFLLYNTRTACWFFLPSFPSLPLNAALWAV